MSPSTINCDANSAKSLKLRLSSILPRICPFSESVMLFLEGFIPQVLINRQLSTRSASLTIWNDRELLHSSRCMSVPDNVEAAFITSLGICIFIGVGISPVNISSASCHNAHRVASVRTRLPRPNSSSSQKASAIIATLNECSATDWGRSVGTMVHRSTLSIIKA